MGKPWYKTPSAWIIGVAIAAAAFIFGRYIPSSVPAAPPKPLRLSGYQFIDPLLACNSNNSRVFPEDRVLSGNIASIIDSRISAGDLEKASVYFADLSNGKWASVYPDEQYYPSSLGKVPIMMAYYEMADASPDVLNKEITYTGGPDLNETQDIKPAETIAPGKTYTVGQLIQYMIEDSDNNAAQLLFDNVDQEALNNIYRDLGIPTVPNVNGKNLDSVTPQQVSFLFRVLYNGTYLSRDYSEKALSLMSQSSFTQGIVAGLGAPLTVSHKLGLVGIKDSLGNVTEHELHDCGIVYGRDPYLLCVMTRGSSDLSVMEKTIADISAVTYRQVEEGD